MSNQGFTSEDIAHMSVFTDNWQVTWELYLRFGMRPATGDRYLGEHTNWFLQGGGRKLTC